MFPLKKRGDFVFFFSTIPIFTCIKIDIHFHIDGHCKLSNSQGNPSPDRRYICTMIDTDGGVLYRPLAGDCDVIRLHYWYYSDRKA